MTPYKGPYAVFTDDELKYIRTRARIDRKTPTPSLRLSVISKVNRVLGMSDVERQQMREPLK